MFSPDIDVIEFLARFYDLPHIFIHILTNEYELFFIFSVRFIYRVMIIIIRE